MSAMTKGRRSKNTTVAKGTCDASFHSDAHALGGDDDIPSCGRLYLHVYLCVDLDLYLHVSIQAVIVYAPVDPNPNPNFFLSLIHI